MLTEAEKSDHMEYFRLVAYNPLIHRLYCSKAKIKLTFHLKFKLKIPTR